MVLTCSILFLLGFSSVLLYLVFVADKFDLSSTLDFTGDDVSFMAWVLGIATDFLWS